MTRLRKRWKLTYAGSDESDEFASQASAYGFVQVLARSKLAGGDITDQLTVWMDEGNGWTCYEVVDMVELAGLQGR